jgi:hypothetical protein
MGVNYSKIMCVDTTKKCAQLPLIPYTIYSKNIKDKTTQQVREYVCGKKNGVETQCCDPHDPASQEIVKTSNLIKSVRDKDGNYTEFHVCDCTDKQCEDQYCSERSGFTRPTQYEKCRARALDAKNNVQVSDHVYKVLAANTYTNCYQLC